MKHGNVRNYLDRHDYFRDVGNDAQGKKKRGRTDSRRPSTLQGPGSSIERAREVLQSRLVPPSNVVVFNGVEEVCEVTPHSEAAALVGYDISSAVNKVVALPLAGTTALPKLHGFVAVRKHRHKKAGGIIKHSTNAVKNLAATQAFPGDNVDEGRSLEPPAKKAKQPAKPAARAVRARGGAGARAGGGLGRSGHGPAARPPWQH
eukprot:jgi/Tetstr1/457456/TSEL_044040.t1